MGHDLGTTWLGKPACDLGPGFVSILSLIDPSPNSVLYELFLLRRTVTPAGGFARLESASRYYRSACIVWFDSF